MGRADDQLSRLCRATVAKRIPQLGLTQAEVAEKVGVTPEYLSRILHGRQRVHTDLAEAMLAAVRCRLVVSVEESAVDYIAENADAR